MEGGVGQAKELKVYPTTRTGKIPTIRQENFDSVTVPFGTKSLLAKRENMRAGGKSQQLF